jgi:hypothetical protein
MQKAFATAAGALQKAGARAMATLSKPPMRVRARPWQLFQSSCNIARPTAGLRTLCSLTNGRRPFFWQSPVPDIAIGLGIGVLVGCAP